jgi:hypothetical protein
VSNATASANLVSHPEGRPFSILETVAADSQGPERHTS